MRFALFLLASVSWAGNSWVTGNGAAMQQITNGSVPTQNGAYCIGVDLNNVPTVLTNTYVPAPQLLGYSYTGTALSFYAQVLTNVDVVLTAPNGAVTTTNCSSSPCAVVADARQGNVLMTLNYKSSGGAVLATSGSNLVSGLTLTVQ